MVPAAHTGGPVRKTRSTVAAAFILCAGMSEVSAVNLREDFEAARRMGTAWAWSGFLQQYQAYYAALQHSSRPHPPVTSPNYGDNYFMQRHLKLGR